MVRERAKSPASRPPFETHRFATLLRMRTPAESESGGGTVMFTLMVRSASLRVSNHEAEHAASLRDSSRSLSSGAHSRGGDAPQDDAGSLGGTGNPRRPAVAPPSIGSVMPVIQRASSLPINSAP